jgi:hypothetical protein
MIGCVCFKKSIAISFHLEDVKLYASLELNLPPIAFSVATIKDFHHLVNNHNS